MNCLTYWFPTNVTMQKALKVSYRNLLVKILQQMILPSVDGEAGSSHGPCTLGDVYNLFRSVLTCLWRTRPFSHNPHSTLWDAMLDWHLVG
jgi:hypothetical protein